VLDLGLPQLDGRDVLQRLRQRGDGLAVLVVTARDGLAERVRVLDPVPTTTWSSRSRWTNSKPRARPAAPVTSNGNPDLRIGRLRIDLAGHRVWIDDQSLELTARVRPAVGTGGARRAHRIARSWWKRCATGART
jgi:two-component system OmpR family response regulator